MKKVQRKRSTASKIFCHLEQVCGADASKLCAVEAEPSSTKLSGEAREGYSRSLYILSIGKELFFIMVATACVACAMGGYTLQRPSALQFLRGQIKDLTCKNFDSFVGAFRHKLAQGDNRDQN